MEAIEGFAWDSASTVRGGQSRSTEAPGFEALVEYTERHGTSAVPDKHITTDDLKLGAYVQGLRQPQKRGQLDSEMLSILKDLPGWTTDVHETAWEEGFADLLPIQRAHGPRSASTQRNGTRIRLPDRELGIHAALQAKVQEAETRPTETTRRDSELVVGSS